MISSLLTYLHYLDVLAVDPYDERSPTRGIGCDIKEIVKGVLGPYPDVSVCTLGCNTFNPLIKIIHQVHVSLITIISITATSHMHLLRASLALIHAKSPTPGPTGGSQFLLPRSWLSTMLAHPQHQNYPPPAKLATSALEKHHAI